MKAGGNKVDYVGKTQKVFDGIVKNLKFLGADGQILTAGKSGKVPPGQISGTGNVTEAFRYFYHPDHLGSTSYVTDASGEVYQHLEYFAFGETFVEEHSNTDRTPYLFNGKELDEETGLYYYGARYYDARVSVWMSVDPMAEKFSDMTPYNYTFNNPIKYNDPDGRCPICPGAFIDLAVRAKLWFDKLSGATQRLATGKSGNMASDAPAPNDVRRMQRVLGTMNDTGTVAQSVVDVGEGAAQIISSIPGVETGGDIAGVFYYGLIKGDGESAAMHAVAIFLPAVSGSQIKAIGKFASESKQLSHFEKHAAEFAGRFKNADEYLKGAQDFFKNISDDVVQFTRKNGDVVQYNAKTNEFGAIDKDGNIRTFFKPERGKDYFMDQVKKEAGNGG